ncbi:hypothetical protein PGTUg99_027614 [Puccinia graminis f. sp. tritici]|uniref:Uncharacterized protein n=1 Tax=Puccinia graminis f. sp. tritici TaxID=56615 RepID=A0A5B0R6H4_PUCGR|nr:hypothetical protein PGTUg99_027614 [Puccinia graminis f. sp. tritici]
MSRFVPGPTAKNGLSQSVHAPMQPLLKAEIPRKTGAGSEENDSSRLSESRQVLRYYPSQILSWSAPVITYKAACATAFMVKEFQLALLDIPSGVELNKMQDSDQIFVPFVYKLMIKPFPTQKWSQMLQVWRSLWYFSDSSLAKSHRSRQTAQHILMIKRFLWISDFISVVTIPQFFEHPEVGSDSPSGSIKYDYSLMAIAEVNIMRLLSSGSDGSKIFKRITHNTSLLRISDALNRECADGNEDLDLQSVLELLHAKAKLIVPKTLGLELQANKLEESSSTHDPFLKKLMEQYGDEFVEEADGSVWR